MAIAAVVDEGGLERRLYAGDFGEIDIPAQRSLACGFEVKFLDAIPSQNHHPGFLRVRGVDDHFVGHDKLSRRARKCAAGADRAVRPRRVGRLCWRWKNTEMGRQAPRHETGQTHARRGKAPAPPNGGRRVVVLPSGHRQPEIETSLAAPPLSGAARRRCHDFDPSRSVGPCPAGQLLPSACNRPARMLAGRIKTGKRSGGSTTRPGLSAQPAGHRKMVPAECPAQPMSEPAARTRSEFVTPHK